MGMGHDAVPRLHFNMPCDFGDGLLVQPSIEQVVRFLELQRFGKHGRDIGLVIDARQPAGLRVELVDRLTERARQRCNGGKKQKNHVRLNRPTEP